MLGQLMACMAAMLKDYKAEIEDILVADKQLAKELLFDMKQAEQAAKQQQQQQQQAGTGRWAAGAPSTPRHGPPPQQQPHPGRTPGSHGSGPALTSLTPARGTAGGAAAGEGAQTGGPPLSHGGARSPGAALLAACR